MKNIIKNDCNITTTNKFIEKKDIEVLKNLGINYEEDIKIFLKEMREYLNNNFSEKYYIKNSINSIIELNRKYLCNYPSTEGYYILDNVFTCGVNIDILCYKSKIILGYLYNIHLR